MDKTIFIVDDSNISLAALEYELESHYNVITMPSGARLFAMLEKIRPDIILLDIYMPEMDGFQVMKLLKQSQLYADIPVIFLTGTMDEKVEVKGLEMGAVDFMHKPYSAPILRNRINHHINISHIIQERTQALESVNRNLLYVLADVVESRDQGTGGHIYRTTQYVRLLSESMMEQGVYEREMRGWDIEDIMICAALHDIGKIEVPDAILNKPSGLTEEEFEVMKTHSLIGTKILNKVMERINVKKYLLQARLFAEFHHENWDGSGYPHGLAGEDIPLQGRIMAVADVYDALVSVRPYKKSFTNDEAMDIILKESGKKFDPQIVEVLVSVKDEFAELHKEVN